MGLSKFQLLIAGLGLAISTLQSVAIAAGDVGAGERKSYFCRGCHSDANYRNVFPDVYSIPKIRGQTAEYIKYTLHQYKQKTRLKPELVDSMSAIVASLSDEDIEDLAAYYGAQGK